MMDDQDETHAHHCRRCDVTWHCNDPEHQDKGKGRTKKGKKGAKL